MTMVPSQNGKHQNINRSGDYVICRNTTTTTSAMNQVVCCLLLITMVLMYILCIVDC